MTDHEHSDYVKRTELDGFGKRLNEAEKEQEGVKVKTERNEADITKLFQLAGENAKGLNAIENTLASLLGRIAGAVAAVSALVVIVAEVVKYTLGK